ncbi:MAG: mycofactocin-coupled SDR family oxidoreductase [Microthrixaceae bacterium]
MATSQPSGAITEDVDAPVALITGAARGIGAATAVRLAADGWRVAAADICADIDVLRYHLGTRADLDATVAACAERGTEAIGLVADVRDQSQVDHAVLEAVARFGRIDAVVAAAGVITGGDPAWEIDEEVFTTNVDVNLTGVWRTFKAAVPHLLATPRPRHGRLVAIASAAGMRGNPTIADYTVAKHGVVGLVRSLALELGRRGITVNAVAPGSTTTAILDATAELYHLDDVGEFAVHHTIGRNLDPSEIAAGVAWLVSPERDGVTGIVLPVDGGMTI